MKTVNEKKNEETGLDHELRVLAEGGIRTDRKRLLEDMCAQFSDPREWIREYVVNAFDAQARRCWISGQDKGDVLLIVVEDDGHGMDEAGVLSFNKVYRSIKRGDQSIGTHGIGKVSIAAVTGQCGFSMTTSTGKEAWKMNAGNLLAEEPITIVPVQPVPPRGTRFEITFKKSCGIDEEMAALAEVLKKYCRYLPIRIILFTLEGSDPEAPESAKIVEGIQGDWLEHLSAERFGCRYVFQLGDMGFDVVMGVGHGRHRLFQKYVFVTDRYNLLFHGLEKAISVPHLDIRVESRDFALPFGRHRLLNEEILTPLARHLRSQVLPSYFAELARCYEEGLLGEYGISSALVEEMALGLMHIDAGPERTWSRIPVFATRNMGRLSLAEAKERVSKEQALYIEDVGNPGADYGAFMAPVIALSQTSMALEFLDQLFGNKMMNLAEEGLILEALEGSAPNLGEKEKRFSEFLGFHPHALKAYGKGGISRTEDRGREWGGFMKSLQDRALASGTFYEDRMARDAVSGLQWRLGYLVGRDGRTPCRTHRFLHRQETVVLNLYHSDIQDLVRLSETAPALASHFSLSLCLGEENGLLPHLKSEGKEALIVLDAMAKCGMKNPPSIIRKEEKGLRNTRALREFLREAEGQHAPAG